MDGNRSIKMILSLLAVAMSIVMGCQPIVAPPEDAPLPNASYAWTASLTSHSFTRSDGSTRTLELRPGYFYDSSRFGAFQLPRRSNRDSILVSGLTDRTFVALPEGATLRTDSSYLPQSLQPTVLLPDPNQLYFFDHNKFVAYDRLHDTSIVRATLDDQILFAENPSGKIWYAIAPTSIFASTDSGFHWTRVVTLPHGQAVATTSTIFGNPNGYGLLWVAANDGTIYQWDGKSLTTFCHLPNGEAQPTAMAVHGLSSTLFVGTANGTLYHFYGRQLVRTDTIPASPEPAPIIAIGLDFGSNHDRVIVATSTAIFEARKFGMPPWTVIQFTHPTALIALGTHIYVGTADGGILDIVAQDSSARSVVIPWPSTFRGAVRAIGATYADIDVLDAQAIHRFDGSWHETNLQNNLLQTAASEWLLLTNDSTWHAARLERGQSVVNYDAHVVEHADEININGKRHEDVLVVKFEADDQSVDPALNPVYVLYFEKGNGLIRSERILPGQPSVIEEIN